MAAVCCLPLLVPSPEATLALAGSSSSAEQEEQNGSPLGDLQSSLTWLLPVGTQRVPVLLPSTHQKLLVAVCCNTTCLVTRFSSR